MAKSVPGAPAGRKTTPPRPSARPAPARSNRGGALRGADRAAYVKAMPKGRPTK